MTTTIVTRSGKGSPLTNTELDANFTNLKTTADGAISSTGNNTLSGNLIVTGDLEVQGTTTSIDSTTVEITDLNITLAKDATNNSQANGAGITIAGSSAELKYVSSGDKWTLNKNLDVSGTIQDSNGTFLSSSSVSTFGGTLIDDADAAAARTTLGLGTAATSATGDFFASTSVSTFGASLIDDADASAARTTLGLGTMATSSSSDFLALTGGTLTGGLSGTSATLSGSISSGAITSTGLTVNGSAKLTGSASANTDSITIGFTAPDGEIKVKNSSGAPASNLDFYTTNSSGTTAIALRILAGGGLSISTGNVTMDGTLIGVSALGMGGAITGATSVQTDSIIEKTADNGVSIDGVTVKDGAVYLGGTGAANKLDDYEEGTFTPTYTVAGGGTAGTVTSTNVGTYTKVGSVVTVAVTSFYVPTSGTVPTSYSMTLPFAVGLIGGQSGNGSGREVSQTGASMFISVGNNATTAVIKALNGAAPPANAFFNFSFTYQIA